jgi:hypothetical protein
MLKFPSSLSKFLCAQLHFVTAKLAILHKNNNFHTQTEFVARSKKERKFPPQDYKLHNQKKKKNVVRRDILRLTPGKCPSSQNTGYRKRREPPKLQTRSFIPPQIILAVNAVLKFCSKKGLKGLS